MQNQIAAKIVADSVNEFGNRITTMQVTFPRFILAELNTHRMFSRNSASSRAIPFEKMLKSVEENPFIPIAWQKDHKGMQGTEYWEEGVQFPVERWLIAKNNAIKLAKDLSEQGVTKQLCNRLLEPFMWHTVLITATEWENFFELRCPIYKAFGNVFRSKKDCIKKYSANSSLTDLDWLQANEGQAEIHMMALAEAMWDAYNESTPKQLKAGEWHIPFGDDINMLKLSETVQTMLGTILTNHDKYVEKAKIEISTSMNARISYTVVGEENKEPNYEADIKLHDRLLKSGHMSPFEHIGRAMSIEEMDDNLLIEDGKVILGVSRNFRGFIQYRSLIDSK